MKLRGFLIPFAGWMLLIVGAGCSPKDAMRKWTPPEDDKLARQFMDALQRGKTLEAELLLAPNLMSANVDSSIQTLSALFQARTVKNIEEVGVNSNTFKSGTTDRKTVTLSYQVELSSGWLIGSIVIVDEGHGGLITGARFNPSPVSLQELNRFTFHGKSASHYWFLTLAILIPIFSLWVLVLCARSKIRKKWLWMIFILFGIVTFRLNWTTGELSWQLINIQLLGTSVVKFGIYAPWIFAISLPIGAVTFLLRRERLLVTAKSTADVSP